MSGFELPSLKWWATKLSSTDYNYAHYNLLEDRMLPAEAMKTYGGRTRIAPLIVNLVTSCQPHTSAVLSRGNNPKTHSTEGLLGSTSTVGFSKRL
jgi:hypothetical protein